MYNKKIKRCAKKGSYDELLNYIKEAIDLQFANLSTFQVPLSDGSLILKSHAAGVFARAVRTGRPGLGVVPTSVSENPKRIFRNIARLRYPESGIPTPSGQSPSIRSCLCYLNAPQKAVFTSVL